MTLYETIISIYPELDGSSAFQNGIIILQNDSDGLGDYIAEWNYPQPVPKGIKVGKE
jgi:hypothetical protein